MTYHEADRRADDREVAGLDVLETDALLLVRRDDVGGIGATENGVQIGAVEEAVLRPGGGAVIVPLRHWIDGAQVQGDTDRAAFQVQGTEGLHRQAMPEQEVMDGLRRLLRILYAGGIGACAVAPIGDDPRLIDGDPGGYRVPQCAEDHLRVRRKPPGHLPVRPAATVLQGLRQVPVVEGGHGADAALQQPIHQPLVEIQPLLIDAAGARRLHARPGDGEAV